MSDPHYSSSQFVYGYTRFLDSNWFNYNYNPYGFFNNTPGLFGLSNYALHMSIVNSLSLVVSQLEGINTSDNQRETVLEEAHHHIHNRHQPHHIADESSAIDQAL